MCGRRKKTMLATVIMLRVCIFDGKLGIITRLYYFTVLEFVIQVYSTRRYFGGCLIIYIIK